MSSDINHNPSNEPRFPISPMVDDTEGHGRERRIEEAGADTEGHGRERRIEEAGEDTEGHLRVPRG